MRLMGLKDIDQTPRVSQCIVEQKKFPYLLRDLVIDRPDQVWCLDVTYIRTLYGFIFLVASMDWFSR